MHKKKAQRVYEGHEGPVLCMTTDEKETQLYSGSQDSKIIKWDIARQEILKKIDAHQSAVLTITVCKIRPLKRPKLRLWLSPILPQLRLGKKTFHAKFWAFEIAGTFVRVRLKFVLN